MKISLLLKIISFLAVIVSIILITLQFLLNKSIKEEREAYQQEAEFRRLGIMLADASDYLTNEARKYVQFGDKVHYDNYWTEVNITKTRDYVVERLRELNATEEELNLIELAKRNSDALVATEDSAMFLVTKGNFDLARKLMFDERYEYNKSIIMNPISEFQDLMNSRAREKSEKEKNDTSVILVWTNIFIGILSFVIIFISIFLYKSLKPLEAVSLKMLQLSTNEGDLTSRLIYKGKNEIGVLARSFNALMESLRKIVLQIKQNGLMVTSSSNQISASSRQLEATVNEQVASTNEVVATAKQISNTTSTLLKTINEVSELSNNATEKADKGYRSLSTMEVIMNQMEEATSTISEKLTVINEKAGNITAMTKTITKVSDQTNLLSLNAAIEAEKAGESGRGFAVVAREIRRLADQTAVATLDIKKIVNEMRAAVSEGVMSMEKFAHEVKKGVNETRKLNKEFLGIIENVKNLSPKFETVNEGMHSQNESATAISEAMVQLSKAAQQTAESIRETNKAIEQLNIAANELQKEFSHFKV